MPAAIRLMNLSLSLAVANLLMRRSNKHLSCLTDEISSTSRGNTAEENGRRVEDNRGRARAWLSYI